MIMKIESSSKACQTSQDSIQEPKKVDRMRSRNALTTKNSSSNVIQFCTEPSMDNQHFLQLVGSQEWTILHEDQSQLFKQVAQQNDNAGHEDQLQLVQTRASKQQIDHSKSRNNDLISDQAIAPAIITHQGPKV